MASTIEMFERSRNIPDQGSIFRNNNFTSNKSPAPWKPRLFGAVLFYLSMGFFEIKS